MKKSFKDREIVLVNYEEDLLIGILNDTYQKLGVYYVTNLNINNLTGYCNVSLEFIKLENLDKVFKMSEEVVADFYDGQRSSLIKKKEKTLLKHPPKNKRVEEIIHNTYRSREKYILRRCEALKEAISRVDTENYTVLVQLPKIWE